MSLYRSTLPLVFGVLLLGCHGETRGSVEPPVDASMPFDAGDSDAGQPGCGLGQEQQELAVIDRSIIGSPVDYAPDLGLRSRDDELVHSMRARRETAWQVVKRVLTPVALDVKLPHVAHPT